MELAAVTSGLSTGIGDGAVKRMIPLWPHNGWHAWGHTVVRNIAEYNRVGANRHIVANGDGSQNFGTRAYVDIIPDYRRDRLIDTTESDHDAVSNSTVVAEFGIPAYDNAAEMIDDEIAADLDLAGQLDARNDLHKFECNPIEQGKELSQ